MSDQTDTINPRGDIALKQRTCQSWETNRLPTASFPPNIIYSKAVMQHVCSAMLFLWCHDTCNHHKNVSVTSKICEESSSSLYWCHVSVTASQSGHRILACLFRVTAQTTSKRSPCEGDPLVTSYEESVIRWWRLHELLKFMPSDRCQWNNMQL